MKKPNVVYDLYVGGMPMTITAKSAGQAVSIARKNSHRRCLAQLAASPVSSKERKRLIGNVERMFLATTDGGWKGVICNPRHAHVGTVPITEGMPKGKSKRGGNSKWYRRVLAMREAT